jgi:hypothetical protein
MSIEQEVREMLNVKVRTAPTLEEPPQPVLRRARTRRVMNSVGLTIVVGILATGSVLGVRSLGTSGTIEPVAPGPGTVVPWAALRPAAAATLRPCRASDVDFAADAGGAPFFVLTAKNADVACQVDRGLTMRLFDANGKQLNVPTSVANTFTRAILTDPKISPNLHFRWKNECPPTAEPIRYQLTLPHDGGTLSTTATRLGESTLADPADCDTLRSNATMTFTGVGSTEAGPPYKNPIDNLVIEMKVPESVQAGRVLRYTVTLSNHTHTAISLIDCPTFEQTLGIDDRIERRRNRLNCDAAPAIVLPGSTLEFAMEFPIPGNAGPQPNLEFPEQSPKSRQALIGWRFIDSALSGASGGVAITPFS